MSKLRIALANLRFPRTPDESVALVKSSIAEAGMSGADIICFPECYVPGYRGPMNEVAPPDAAFLERAWEEIAQAAGNANVTVILGTERLIDSRLYISALVINRDGTVAGFQDKVQLDPSEDNGYTAGAGRSVFAIGDVKFGVSICHEGWRYPETVRWPAVHGAQIVFHPHYHWAEPDGYVPATFADPNNTFHEKAALCRSAENTIYFAMVNYASPGSPTTSAVINPDGTLKSFQPYGQEGLLIVDIDTDGATGLLAKRLRPLDYDRVN